MTPHTFGGPGSPALVPPHSTHGLSLTVRGGCSSSAMVAAFPPTECERNKDRHVPPTPGHFLKVHRILLPVSHLLECTHLTALGWTMGWEMWALLHVALCPDRSLGFTEDEEGMSIGAKPAVSALGALTARLSGLL